MMDMNQVFISAFIDELEKLSAVSKTVSGQSTSAFVDQDAELAKDIPKVQGIPKMPLTKLTPIAKATRNPTQPVAAVGPPVNRDIPLTSTVQGALDTSTMPMGEQSNYQANLKAGLTGLAAGNTKTLTPKIPNVAKASGTGVSAVNVAVNSSKGSGDKKA